MKHEYAFRCAPIVLIFAFLVSDAAYEQRGSSRVRSRFFPPPLPVT